MTAGNSGKQRETAGNSGKRAGPSAALGMTAGAMVGWEARLQVWGLGQRFGAAPGSEGPEADDLLVEFADAQELAENEQDYRA